MTIGGGRSGDASHARGASKDWSKMSQNKAELREEAKYGIGLKTMGGGGDDASSSHSSRGSNEIELAPQSTVSVTVRSPGRSTFPENDPQPPPQTARERYHGTKLAKRNAPSYPHHDNRIWQHREVEVTTEPVEPESVLPEPNSKRRSGHHAF